MDPYEDNLEPEIDEAGPDPYEAEEPARYLTADDLDAHLSERDAALMERLLAGMREGSPHPGLAPTHDDYDPDPYDHMFGGDDYAAGIAREIAPMIRQEMAEELRGVFGPILQQTAQSGFVHGLDDDVAEAAHGMFAHYPQLAMAVQNDPVLAEIIRDAAAHRARTSTMPASPPAGRSYHPSRGGGMGYSSEQQAAADAVFGGEEWYQGLHGGRR